MLLAILFIIIGIYIYNPFNLRSTIFRGNTEPRKTSVPVQENCSQNTSNTGIAQKLNEFLNEIEFKFGYDQAKGEIKFGITDEHGTIRSLIKISEERYIYYISSGIPLDFPDTKLYRVMETILRLNEHIMFGNFNLNYDSRSIYFTSTMVNCEILNKEYIERAFRSHFATINDFMPLFKRVIFNDQEPLISVMEMFGHN